MSSAPIRLRTTTLRLRPPAAGTPSTTQLEEQASCVTRCPRQVPPTEPRPRRRRSVPVCCDRKVGFGHVRPLLSSRARRRYAPRRWLPLRNFFDARSLAALAAADPLKL